MGQKAVFLALHVHNCSPGIVPRRAYVFSSLSLSLSPFFFRVVTHPTKESRMVLTKSGLPEKLHIWLEVTMKWFYYYSQNTSMAFTVKEPRWVTVSSGICFPPLKSRLEARWKRQWQLLGLSLCSLSVLWRSWSVKKTHALSLFYNAALCFPVSIRTSTIF